MSAKRGPHVPNYSRNIAVRAAEHGWHVQFYPHDADIMDYADKLLALPNTIVLDHFAAIPADGGTNQPAATPLPQSREELMVLHRAARERRINAEPGSHEWEQASDEVGRIEVEIARVEREMDPPRV